MFKKALEIFRRKCYHLSAFSLKELNTCLTIMSLRNISLEFISCFYKIGFDIFNSKKV